MDILINIEKDFNLREFILCIVVDVVVGYFLLLFVGSGLSVFLGILMG